MTQFSRRSRERIASVVRAVEGMGAPGWRARWQDNPAAPFEFARFELTEALRDGGPAEAYRLGYDRDDDEYVTLTSAPKLSIHGWSAAISLPEGTRGVAIRSQDTPGGRWEIVAWETRPMILSALVDGDADHTDASITIKTVTVAQPEGAAFSDDDPEPTSVTNAWGMPAEDGAAIVAWRIGDAWYGLPRPKTTECE